MNTDALDAALFVMAVAIVTLTIILIAGIAGEQAAEGVVDELAERCRR